MHGMKEVEIPDGTRFVGMLHMSMWHHLCLVYKELSNSQKAFLNFTKVNGINPSDTNLKREYVNLYQCKSFYASCARIYPALYLEGLINFIASRHDLPFHNELENLSIRKKYKIYICLITKRTLEKKYFDFINNVVKLRDYEVHPKAKVSIKGKEMAEFDIYKSDSYHQCTLGTTIVSITKLHNHLSDILTSKKITWLDKLPEFSEYLTCHYDINKRFMIE